MPTLTNNQTTTNPQPQAPIPKLHKRSIVTIAIILLVIVLSVAGTLYYNHTHKHLVIYGGVSKNLQASQSKGQYSFKYSGKTGLYTVPGASAGGGLSFSLPAEFSALEGSTQPQQAVLYHTVNQAGVTLPYATIAAADTASATTPSYVAALGATLAKSSNPGYAATIEPLQDFAGARVGSNYTLTFQDAKAFDSSAISSGAWEVEFSGTAQKQIANMFQPPIKGQAVMAAGKNGFYYFLISANTNNWTANQSLWTKVFNSLQIDQ